MVEREDDELNLLHVECEELVKLAAGLVDPKF